MFKLQMSVAAAVLLLACLHSATATQDDGCYPWETERGGACYGNLLSYKSPAKAHSSDYVRIPGGLIYSGPITGATPVYGGLPTDTSLLANQAISNMITVLEAAGASRMDILRNPVRSNDVATLSNDPNNALVIRAALAGATHTVYDLIRNGVVNWDKYPSDQERRPPGRSYVIMPNTETIVMVVTAFVGSNRDFVHDYLTEQQTIQFNNLRWDWTTLAPADQQTLENSGFVVTVNGAVQRYHYSSPTSLSYTPNITICDGPGGNNGIRGCRRVALRSCERAFSMMDQATQVLNAAGLVVAGNLRWKGQLYPCTDVINYNGGGARWCRIRDDTDIRVAFEIAEAHHINGRENLGFTADDDVLLDLFMTNPDVQYPLFREFLQRNYPSGKYPAVVINFGRLVGGDKIELTGEHSTGPKRRASSDRRRRVTVASLEGYDTIAVGSEAYGTVHTPHFCSATACVLPPNPLDRIRAAFANALADLQSVGHTGVEGVTRVEVFVKEELYPRPGFPAPAVDMKALAVQVVQELWAPFTLPVVFIEPHRDVYGNYVAQVGGRTVELGNTVQVSLRSVKA